MIFSCVYSEGGRGVTNKGLPKEYPLFSESEKKFDLSHDQLESVLGGLKSCELPFRISFIPSKTSILSLRIVDITLETRA